MNETRVDWTNNTVSNRFSNEALSFTWIWLVDVFFGARQDMLLPLSRDCISSCDRGIKVEHAAKTLAGTYDKGTDFGCVGVGCHHGFHDSRGWIRKGIVGTVHFTKEDSQCST